MNRKTEVGPAVGNFAHRSHDFFSNQNLMGGTGEIRRLKPGGWQIKVPKDIGLSSVRGLQVDYAILNLDATSISSS